MLKSHFQLVYDDEEAREEEEPGVDAVEEEQDNIPPRPLSNSEISVRLSMLGKTSEGDGYTYLKCRIVGLKLTRIDVIKSFKHLLFLDVSNNLLDIGALQVIAKLPYLILIQADDNRISSAAIKQMKYLQCIIMNNNQITSVSDVFQEQLSTIELGNNKLQQIDFGRKVATLRVIDFRDNLIKDISNLSSMDFPILDSLYLAGNKLKSLQGIEKLVNLRILHVRHNPIRLLDGFDEAHTKLIYINLRSCKVKTLKQIKKLKVLKNLQTLVLTGCPFLGGTGEEEDAKDVEDDPQLRVEVLAALPRLKRLNKEIITAEERAESKELMMQWLEEEEKDEEEEIEEEQGVEEQTLSQTASLIG